MYIVTTISNEQLHELVEDGKLQLSNSEMFFDYDVDLIDNYFKDRLGSDGYVLGLRGRLNNTTASILANLDTAAVRQGAHRLFLEAEIDPEDVVRYTMEGVCSAAEALHHGFSEDSILGFLDSAEKSEDSPKGVEILCVRALRHAKVRIGSPVQEIRGEIEGVSLVKLDFLGDKGGVK